MGKSKKPVAANHAAPTSQRQAPTAAAGPQELLGNAAILEQMKQEEALCVAPAAPGPVATPYPDMASSDAMDAGSKRVKVGQKATPLMEASPALDEAPTRKHR